MASAAEAQEAIACSRMLNLRSLTLQVGQPVAVVEQGAEAAPAAEAPADDKPAEEKPKAEAKNVPAAEQKGDKPEAPPPPPPPKPKPEPAKAPQPSKAEAAVRTPLSRLGVCGMDTGVGFCGARHARYVACASASTSVVIPDVRWRI